ncbi:39S ribosomal protein L21, mitochondrial [Desmophyllum pertusum]|uniref:Large ribosomal subunit protein bL21m n=1 Tax=Desmophyllum pertusum TaxID=174260 RepID=A0A9W9ZKZ7_9CNID|nr:39S ribosomal protein L21, mitochondrial [Desmophyllum pertusum]
MGLCWWCEMPEVSSDASSSSLTEGGEEDDEQNCPPYSSGTGVIKDVQDEMLKGETSGQIFAVVYIGGSQFKITVNDTIIINRIDAETGDRIRIEKVLLVGGENFTVIGTPLLARDLARIEATVVEKTKAPKKIVFKMKEERVIGDLKNTIKTSQC